MKALLNRVLKNDLCSGCGMCSSVASDDAVQIRLNADGYHRPVLNKAYQGKTIASEQASSAFAKSCPALNLDIRPYKSANYHPIWGEILDTLKGHAVDNEVRQAGSSGGVISALAQYCLDRQLVDGVIQIQASQTDPLENTATISRSRQNIIASSGSRYAPASPAQALKWVAMSTEKYLFIGKPCDVAAVRQMQAHDPRLQQNIPYVVSFMCAGTPSLHGTEQVLDQLGVQRDDVSTFRYRGDGWPGLTKATLKNGDARTMTYNDSWGKVLNRHLQTRCKICPDGIGEFADIVCADGWEGDEKGYPSFEEREGNSLILLRTEKGRSLFRNAEADGVVKAEAFDTASIFTIQPFQYYRRTTILPRLWAMKLLMLKTPSYKGFELGKGMKEIGLYQSFKAFTGLLVRRKKIKRRALETA
ncbi:Coenzyme F420 hydrogenase/dehydrogenase, beta subunit C-terminal domain [Stutzerimonas stutzeri]|uniref:Coenzyme F420 hydrogenase/dehydrogenase, beta subunit C-terminal domain n=1 Tax=Stutzerimonas sp. S1 TaxID=3030652 RepID=UPI0022246F30|nr:Coenzyme F420 hydrogenase/dehydrogenase, beta subunit C-terminal domain [Stutzerimonas sp. S1]MCW3150726.1 Coenzyme F420 hydrogenase/dehydrogenase, beta subunit C-terminal domain [Stutzerimonas sp. S1]